jgi:hypothetical protein
MANLPFVLEPKSAETLEEEQLMQELQRQDRLELLTQNSQIFKDNGVDSPWRGEGGNPVQPVNEIDQLALDMMRQDQRQQAAEKLQIEAEQKAFSKEKPALSNLLADRNRGAVPGRRGTGVLTELLPAIDRLVKKDIVRTEVEASPLLNKAKGNPFIPDVVVNKVASRLVGKKVNELNMKTGLLPRPQLAEAGMNTTFQPRPPLLPPQQIAELDRSILPSPSSEAGVDTARETVDGSWGYEEPDRFLPPPPPDLADMHSSEGGGILPVSLKGPMHQSELDTGYDLIKAAGEAAVRSQEITPVAFAPMEMHRDSGSVQKAAAEIVPEIGTTTQIVDPPIQNQSVRSITNEINKTLKALNEKADPDSTRPFWNWLTDLSDGLRASGKSGNQDLGAIADGFANVREQAKKREATRLASRKISIDNIKNLGELREDIITADRLGAPGTSAMALYGSYLDKPGQVLGANGIIPRGYMEALGYDYRTHGTYSTTKAGRVVQQFHKTDPTKDKKVRFYPINPENKLPTNKGSILVSPTDPKFREYSQNSNFTQTGPSETSVALTSSEIKDMFKGNPAYLKKIKDSGASVRVTKNEDGTIKSFDIHNAQKQDVQGFYNQKTGAIQVGDPNNVNHQKDILSGNLIPVTFTLDTVGKSSSVQLTNEINSARQGVDIINKLKEIRAEGRGKAILGSIATAKKAGGNFADILQQAGQEFLPFYSFGQQLQYDIDNNLVDENVQAWLDKDLATARILETSLIYKYAKILKGTGRLNSDDIRRAEDALGRRGFLKSDVDIFARYEAVLPLFNETIKAKTAQLKKARLAERSLEPDAGAVNSLDPSVIQKIVQDFSTDNRFNTPPNSVSITRLRENPTQQEKNLFEQVYGSGTAALVLRERE